MYNRSAPAVLPKNTTRDTASPGILSSKWLCVDLNQAILPPDPVTYPLTQSPTPSWLDYLPPVSIMLPPPWGLCLPCVYIVSILHRLINTRVLLSWPGFYGRHYVLNCIIMFHGKIKSPLFVALFIPSVLSSTSVVHSPHTNCSVEGFFTPDIFSEVLHICYGEYAVAFWSAKYSFCGY
jgi:hypothetical protein